MSWLYFSCGFFAGVTVTSILFIGDLMWNRRHS